MVHVVVWNAVYRVKVVFSVKVIVVAVHHHDHFVSWWPRCLGVYDIHSIKTARDVLFKGHDMTVVRIYSELFGIEFINEPPSGGNILKYAVHLGLVNSMRVNGMGVGTIVYEVDSDQVTFCSSKG